MIFPRSRQSMRRYGRNKVIAILVTFAIFWIYLKVFVPRGVILTKLGWEPRVTAPSEAFDERWSGVIVAADASVEETMADSTAAGDGPPGAAVVWKRSKVRTTDDFPVVLLYDADEAGGPLAIGEEISFRGVYAWATAGGIVRALASDSTAFGVTRR